MRDQRFIAEHRGGLLKIEQHRRLIEWGCVCTERVISLLGDKTDQRVKNALLVAREWEQGKATVGQARKAAVEAIAAANSSPDPVAVAVARSAGHAVATAHMADHSLGAALYALKAIKLYGKSIDEERKWQNEQLTPDIRKMVLAARILKEIHFKF